MPNRTVTTTRDRGELSRKLTEAVGVPLTVVPNDPHHGPAGADWTIKRYDDGDAPIGGGVLAYHERTFLIGAHLGYDAARTFTGRVLKHLSPAELDAVMATATPAWTDR